MWDLRMKMSEGKNTEIKIKPQLKKQLQEFVFLGVC